MQSVPNNSYPHGILAVGDEQFRVVDLPSLFGPGFFRLPFVLRILLENTIRNARGGERDGAVSALFDWLEHGRSEAEIAFQPGRVLMHDTTATPALVDIAAMRDALAEGGVDPAVLNPLLPVDISVDHSLAVEAFAQPGAAAINLAHEMRRNGERYRFLKWAGQALDNVRLHPPGTGIMHTINLEQLATVVATASSEEGLPWAFPDTLIGTDSHTPMINGIGVLGWGVGGLEAQTVMFGMPTMLRIPEVTGVRLTGALRAPALSTDLALTVTARLRALDVTGQFVEFFGPGAATLSAGDRAVVANMAPEYGATTGYFAIDARTLDYLRSTGRDARQLALVEAYARRTGLWAGEEHAARYSRIIDIALDEIGREVAGPARPHDLMPAARMAQALPAGAAHPIAIAAITSCTNTSDPRLLIAAGLLAKKARALGLAPAAWVKTSLAPGSPAAATYLESAGVLGDLEVLGFGIVGFGCTTCIGNAGPLTAPMRALIEGGGQPVAVLSGNRNFAGRVHPDLALGFLMSPPLVIAYAIAGDAARNLDTEPLGVGANGEAVFLHQVWPDSAEIDAALKNAVADYGAAFAGATRNPAWHALAAPSGARFPWDPASNYLQRPPFAARSEGSLLGNYAAHPLMLLGDDVTTDHISPASAIPASSIVADYLVSRGEDRRDLNVFAARRGNWEVMLRAAFHSRSLVNGLQEGMPIAHTLHVPSGEVLPIWQAAQRYREDREAVVVVAGERYGTGSSRDWAAKSLRLLGVRAVLAESFERIHRSNLIGMGILPLRLAPGALREVRAGDRIVVDADAAMLRPRMPLAVTLVRAEGGAIPVAATVAVETELEVRLLRAGGVLPMIVREKLAGRP